MPIPAFVALAALTLSAPVPGPADSPRPSPAVAAPARRAERPPATLIEARDLYSARARGRFAAYLRMRLLELREEGLERAAEVIRRRLPVDTLLEP